MYAVFCISVFIVPTGENMLTSEREKANIVRDSIHPGFPGTVPVFMGF